METIVERPAALDVHKEQVTACVRVPAADGNGREQHVAEFKTTVRGCSPFAIAGRARRAAGRDGGDGRVLETDLACARGRLSAAVGQCSSRETGPRRKTDVSDAAWLCQLLEAGLLKASFVPPKPIRR